MAKFHPVFPHDKVAALRAIQYLVGPDRDGLLSHRGTESGSGCANDCGAAGQLHVELRIQLPLG